MLSIQSLQDVYNVILVRVCMFTSAVTCNYPGDYLHGTYRSTREGRPRHFGDLLTAECDEGYHLQNATMVTRTCLANGEWSGPSAVCIGKQV